MIGALLFRGAAFALVWWVLAEGRTDSWSVGVVCVGAALAASLHLAPPRAGGISLVGLLSFAGFFVIQALKGGVQVAVRAFRPAMDLDPDLMDMPITLPAGLPRVMLVNTLNLLPGTVCVRLDGDRLRLHVLDARQPIAEEVRELEVRITRLFGASA